MAKKLTLRIEEHLIESAKRYSSITGKSVSALVSDYFSFIQQQEENEKVTYTPKVSSLHGILRETDACKEEYIAHLEKKQQ